MQKYSLLLFNAVAVLITAVLLFAHFGFVPKLWDLQQNLPGPL